MRTLIFLAALLFAPVASAAAYQFQFSNSDSVTLYETYPCKNEKAMAALTGLTARLNGGRPAPASELEGAGDAKVVLENGKKEYAACWMIAISPAGQPFALVGAEDGKADLIPMEAFRPLTDS